ncbi:hypothetical protein TNCV_594871 [Trichonephila clavipes]|nr:hypothetical protein TNCV_594871 [Trichonephila clavipes]
MKSCNHMCCHSCNDSPNHYSTRQCSAYHGQSVTKTVSAVLLPFHDVPDPPDFSLDHLGRQVSIHEFERTRGKGYCKYGTEMSQDILQHLCVSMHDRIASCIHAERFNRVSNPPFFCLFL